MGKALAEFGLQQAGNIIDTGMGLLLEGHNDKRQIKQQQKLTDMQVSAQRNMGQFNFDKQMEMWEKTNYKAQMEQLEKAGLNPGLIYGMGGAGGQTGSAVASGAVSAGQAPHGGGEIQAQQAMGIQRELLQAQKENIIANTEKTKAETGNVPLTGENIQANTQSLLQGIKNQQAIEKLTNAETKLKGIETEYANKTLDDRIDLIDTIAQNAIIDMDRNQTQYGLDRATVLQKAKIIQAEAIGAVLRNALTEVQTKNTTQQTAESKARITKMIQDIQQGWAGLDIQQQRTEIEKFNAEIKANFPGLGNAIGRVINGAFEQITGGLPKGYEIPKSNKTH